MPEDKDSRTVRIGEDSVTIQPFRGYKAVKAGQIIASAMDAVRTIFDELEDYRASYAERHKVTITRSLNRARDLGFRDNAFDDKGELVLPGTPSEQEVLGVAFPRIMALADEQLIDLLALAIAPNKALRDAYDDGDPAEAIKEYRERILFDAELSQLIELTGKVADLLRGELTGLGEQVGKLRGLILGATGEEQTTASESNESTSPTSTSPEDQPPSNTTTTPGTSPPESPTSSTDSDEPTNGPPAKPSLASSGASSSSSGND